MTATQTLVITCGAPALAAVVALVADMLNRPRGGRTAAGLLFALAGAVLIWSGWAVEPEPVWGVFAGGAGHATASGLVLILASTALFAGRDEQRPGVGAALVALAAGGACVALSAVELVTMLIGIEIAAVSAYGLVALAGSRRADEAAMKYFVQGSVATGFFVLGMAILVGLVAPDGRFATMSAVGGSLPTSTLMLGAVGLVSALAFKSGAAPFHSWAPDAYETAPASSASFMAGALKLGMVAALASVVGVLGSMSTSAAALGTQLQPLLGVLALVSVVIGSTVALTTSSYRRLLGYAGVAQVGYALIALTAAFPSGALFFIATYAVGTTAAFVAAVAFSKLRPEWDGSVEGLAGLGRSNPLLGGSVTLVLMSLAGIPPLLGFWGKFEAFGAAIATSLAFAGQGEGTASMWMAALAAVGVIGSIVSLGYYGSIVRALYLPVPEGSVDGSERRVGSGVIAIVVAFALAVVVLGLAPLFVGLQDVMAGFLLSLS